MKTEPFKRWQRPFVWALMWLAMVVIAPLVLLDYLFIQQGWRRRSAR